MVGPLTKRSEELSPGAKPQKYFTSAERAAIFGEYRRRSGVDLDRSARRVCRTATCEC
jgi:hypothetical protein